jgi:hypothetical protein
MMRAREACRLRRRKTVAATPGLVKLELEEQGFLRARIPLSCRGLRQRSLSIFVVNRRYTAHALLTALRPHTPGPQPL